MKQNGFLGVNVAYNGNSPRVTWNISWKGFFAKLWQDLKDFGKKMCQMYVWLWQHRNVFAINAYACCVAAVLLVLMAGGMDVAKQTVGLQEFIDQLWGMWVNFLAAEFGIMSQAHQVGLLVLTIALFMTICSPAVTWISYYLGLKFDKNIARDIRWKLLRQRADAMVARMNNAIHGTCKGVIAVAVGAAVAWMVWTLLQG